MIAIFKSSVRSNNTTSMRTMDPMACMGLRFGFPPREPPASTPPPRTSLSRAVMERYSKPLLALQPSAQVVYAELTPHKLTYKTASFPGARLAYVTLHVSGGQQQRCRGGSKADLT